MTFVENMAVEVKEKCFAINEVTDFAIKQFINSFIEQYNAKLIEFISANHFGSGDACDRAIEIALRDIQEFIKENNDAKT